MAAGKGHVAYAAGSEGLAWPPLDENSYNLERVCGGSTVRSRDQVFAMKNITETIVRLAASYEAVAFDVFDTLLKRDVGSPTDLFWLRGVEFAKMRTEAEAKARSSEKREVTLADIYAQPELSDWDPAQECAEELAASVANRPVLEAVRALHAQRKRVYFISDMYLPQEQIHAMLLRCGYDMLDGGFVSSSYGVQKRSGALFHRFLRETGLKAGQVLFVGDSWRADVLGAALAGIRAWHLPAPQPVQGTVEARDCLSGALRAFVENRLSGVPYDGIALGFSVLGPLQIAYCRWIHAQRQIHKAGRIYFLARDMYLTRAVYSLLYPKEETFYLEVSRRSLCPALLAQQKYDLVAAALPRQMLSVRQIAAYCDATCPSDCAEIQLNLKEQGQGRIQEQLQTILKTLQPSDGSRQVSTYLESIGLRDGDILVDIGSGGTTQMLLESLCGIRLYGLQLSGDERLCTRFPEERAKVFLNLPSTAFRLYWAGQPILERMISQDVGPAIGYFRENGRITVRRGTQKKEPVISQLQQGALAFAREWETSVLQELDVSAALAIEPFLKLVGSPEKDQLLLLGDLSVEDGGIYPLAAPKKILHYLLHPRELKKDLQLARWKIGFLARLLPLRLPYDRLYLAMKK